MPKLPIVVRYSDEWRNEVMERICERIINGEPLTVILRDKGYPPRSMVAEWIVRNVNDFAMRLDRARQARAAFLEDEILEIADDARDDFIAHQNRGEVVNSGAIQRAKLRISARFRLLAAYNPEMYGGFYGKATRVIDEPDNNNKMFEKLTMAELEQLRALAIRVQNSVAHDAN